MALSRFVDSNLHVPDGNRPQTAPGGSARRKLLAGSALAAWGLAAPTWARAQSSSPIRVGFLSPTTGTLSAFGTANTHVHSRLAPLLERGIDTLHMGRRPIKLELFDTGSSPERATALAEKLVAEGIHMLVGAGAPETTNPIADVCERAGVPCLTTVAPWQAWLFGRKGNTATGFGWTFHFFPGLEDLTDVYSSLCKRSNLGATVGALWADDVDSSVFAASFQKAMSRQGLNLFDPGRIVLRAPDFASVVKKLQDANVPILTGVLPPPVAVDFFAAAKQANYRPRLTTIAKAFVFPDTATRVNASATALASEVWWSPAWPFKSTLTGMTAKQLCDDYEATTKLPWLQTLGFAHALVDVVAECVRQAQEPTRESLRDAITHLQVTTVAGVVSFKSRHPSMNVCTTPAVGGQWQKRADGRWVLEVVDNSRAPFIPVTAQLVV